MPASDKKTIGLTEPNRRVLEQVMATGWFKNELDVAMLGMSHAMGRGVEPNGVEGTDTKWNVGSLDPDARSLILAVYPQCSMPYRGMEHLINAGIALIGEGIQQQGNAALREALGCS